MLSWKTLPWPCIFRRRITDRAIYDLPPEPEPRSWPSCWTKPDSSPQIRESLGPDPLPGVPNFLNRIAYSRYSLYYLYISPELGIFGREAAPEMVGPRAPRLQPRSYGRSQPELQLTKALGEFVFESVAMSCHLKSCKAM